MGELEQAFQKLTGRAPTDADVQRLYRVKDALGLAGNDALWQVLIALGYHQSLYEDMPKKIGETAKDTLADVGERAKQVLAAKAQEAQATLTQQVAASAQAIAGQRTRQAMLKAGMWAVVAAGLIIVSAAGAAAWAGWKAGRDAGYEAGRTSLLQEYDTHAVNWAHSHWGRRARTLDAEGLLQWADTPHARMLRDLASRGLVADLWADLDGDDPDLVIAKRADVGCLASEEGRLVLALREAGVLREMVAGGDVDGADMAIVSRAQAQLLHSAVAVWARSQEGASWIPWVRALLVSGLLFENGLPEDQACVGVTEKGYAWRLTNNDRFCEVWQNRVFFRLDP